ncbi:glycine/betaine transmethylase [Desulfosarcina ovata subsp. sediminis]|uniref:Glycine/betaine transmethylase n=1 Tax=Desulfosarcina ovata subsp. sediminis TaxID=885957 RepID=A0A5K7ZN92_9BACT|nr:DUF1302 domain-containing protein [Desulfosarcina ovata]BBO81079.1 glycine/betaine transmethylase [Desulfosarcina ovata subsp. sediminis]
MEKMVSSASSKLIQWRLWPVYTILSSIISILIVVCANAFQLYDGPDLKVKWDTTVKYSAGFRMDDQDDDLVGSANINADDGDRNFDSGLISNRLDVFSEMDILYQNFGFRISGAGWVDTVYLDDNDNDSPGTFNGTGENDEFTDDTEQLHGKNVELLDAFVFGRGKLGNMPVSFRLGRHTMIWGETLFMAKNGIAHGQAPLDAVKAQTVPGTQAKELFMPTGQLSGQIQLNPNLSLNAYWQYEWRRSRMCSAGSYCSDADMIDAGGERILPGMDTPFGPAYLDRGDDLGAGNSTGEFGESNFENYGVGIRFRSEKIDTDFGVYYVHFNENMPYWIYTVEETPSVTADGFKVGEYFLAFPEDIHMIGMSFGTQIGDVNVSGEISGRINAPLVGTSAFDGTGKNNDDNPAYAQGNTLHANLSAIYFMGGTALWEGANLFAEAGYTDLLEITDNDEAVDDSRDDWALGFRMLFEPSYYQVLPGVDITVPLGLGYNVAGKSPTDLKFNANGADRGGDFSVGVDLTYFNVWKFGIKYTNYFGGSTTQTLADRDFISISVKRTF